MSKLTEEMVIARSRQSDLATIKKLNCWGSDLSDVSIIRRMRGVEVLALSVNRITTLQHFQDCRNLQELYLRKNNLQDLGEIEYLQNLPNLKYLWLEENPCCDSAGPNYRAIILRALPNLKKLDNVDVTPEEVEEALNASSMQQVEDDYEEEYERTPQPQQVQAPQQQQQYQQQQHQPQSQQQYSAPQQQQRTSHSTPKENPQHPSPENTEDSFSESIVQPSIPTSPLQRSPTNRDYSPPEQVHPPSPKLNNTRENRMSYHQYDRSPGSEHESPVGSGEYRQRGPLPPSISTHSMKEYYQSDRPNYPAHYRHSQSDLTEWEEHQHNQYNGSGNNQVHHQQQRRSAGSDREAADRYAYRNGNTRENGDWEDERPQRRRPEGRFSDSASVVSTAVLNHYSGYHRRPVNRNSNLLSAILCLVKELDYPSLEVVEHAVRCRIDELATE